MGNSISLLPTSTNSRPTTPQRRPSCPERLPKGGELDCFSTSHWCRCPDGQEGWPMPPCSAVCNTVLLSWPPTLLILKSLSAMIFLIMWGSFLLTAFRISSLFLPPRRAANLTNVFQHLTILTQNDCCRHIRFPKLMNFWNSFKRPSEILLIIVEHSTVASYIKDKTADERFQKRRFRIVWKSPLLILD